MLKGMILDRIMQQLKIVISMTNMSSITSLN